MLWGGVPKALRTRGSRWKYGAKTQIAAIHKSRPPLWSAEGVAIFCPLDHILEAVDGVAFSVAPPLYTAVFAWRAKKKTRAQNAIGIARHSILFCMIRRFKVLLCREPRFRIQDKSHSAAYYTCEAWIGKRVAKMRPPNPTSLLPSGGAAQNRNRWHEHTFSIRSLTADAYLALRIGQRDRDGILVRAPRSRAFHLARRSPGSAESRQS